jgi:hypothetical protein
MVGAASVTRIHATWSAEQQQNYKGPPQDELAMRRIIVKKKKRKFKNSLESWLPQGVGVSLPIYKENKRRAYRDASCGGKMQRIIPGEATGEKLR